MGSYYDDPVLRDEQNARAEQSAEAAQEKIRAAFHRLASKQEPLGSDIEAILYDNLDALYEA